MNFPTLKGPTLVNIIIAIISAIISSFTLLFGFAHLIEGITQIIKGTSPNNPAGESIAGWTIVIFLCVIGVVFLVVTIAAIKGIIDKSKRKTDH
jgi:protein-S-isoprenylcysteine O-methyltransferase Ste14